MSLTLLSRPLGHRLNTTDISAVIIDDGTGDALVYTSAAHGLSDGDYVYIDGNLDSYNGFKYVDSIAYDSFKIKNSEEGDFVEFVQDADISYRTSVLNHGWQAVHNLIVYELESDLWPNNVAEEAYIPVTVVSQADENGNTLLNLSVGIAGATVLNFIELVGDNDLAGPYQILQVDNPWAIVINLAHDAANDFSGLQVVNYYNNYAINVEVWAGLDAGHRWVAKKPYELAATLKFIPDSDGRIKFSIADILKGYITTRNNLTLDTLPNNLDFHVSFYIKYYESYNESDGDDITTFEGEVTTDTFEGHAVNSMMPFKSLNSGHMSDYVNEGDFLARWLTLFDRPLLVVGRFFDISFINQYNGLDVVIIKNGATYLTIPNPGQGVIRVPVTPLTGETEICLQALVSGSGIITLSAFTNYNTGGPAWTTGPAPSVVTNAGLPATDYLSKPFEFISGATYTFTVNYSSTASPSGSLRLRGLDSGFNNIDDDFVLLAAGTNTVVFTLLATEAMVYVAFSASTVSPETITINSMSFSIPDTIVTEEICCDVVDECSSTFVDDLLRITEASQARIIE